jgi:hypothetical protein
VYRCLTIALLFVASLLAGCGGGSTASSSPSETAPALNVLAISVDGGPVATQTHYNGAFASVTICVPRTTTCQTIDGILVDTGSSGLRILQSQVSIPLPSVSASNGVPVEDCIAYPNGSYLWGPVMAADVQLGGEIASSASIHLISDLSSGVPSTCSNSGQIENTPQLLGANGILGVGTEPVDCGSPCDPAGGLTSPPVPAYYTCSVSTCDPAFIGIHSQVVHPATLFAKDNNGVIVKLPSVSGVAASVSGSLIFGIGTQSNNALGSAKVYTLDKNDHLTVDYAGQQLTGSTIDSGAQAMFFPDPAIPNCPNSPVDLSMFYCPTSLLKLSATVVGANNATGNVTFSIDNAQNLIDNNPGDAAFSTLGGTRTGSFDLGLPFFYGREVYTAIRGQSVPSGAPAAPWWAF